MFHHEVIGLILLCLIESKYSSKGFPKLSLFLCGVGKTSHCSSI